MNISLPKKIKGFFFTPSLQQGFLEDLAALIEDGVSAQQAVSYIAHAATGLTQEVAHSILDNLAQGHALADGMVSWFPDHIVELIRVGEEGGALTQIMKSAASALTHKNNAISSLLSSLTYPVMVLIMGLVVTVFINHSVFDNFRAILPLEKWPEIGRAVVGLANTVQYWWWLILILLLILFFALSLFFHRYIGSLRTLLDKAPIFSLYRRFVAASFMQLLGLLIDNGIVLRRALQIIHGNANPYLAWHLLNMEYRLGSGGDNIAEVLDTGLLNQAELLRLRIIAHGKGFEHALIRQGKYAQEQSIRTIQKVGKIAGIIVLGLSGLLAIFLVFGLYTTGFALVAN
ncbi:MAG: type II secretion system F family protein [Pseudomonadota bacterium]